VTQNAIGQPVRRREDPRLLTGQGRFTADLAETGQAHAVMLRSPHAHATITAIDTEAAKAAPGVLAVLTGADYEADKLGSIPPGSPFITLPGTPPNPGFLARPPHPALPTTRVRFVGDTVAMVVAETLAQARDAAELITVDYDPLPAITDTATAQQGAPVWEDAPDNICFRWSAGHTDQEVFDKAVHVVKTTLVNNRIYVGALENRGAIGSYENGRYTLQTGTQMPHYIRDSLHEALATPKENIRVRVADVGGSFGIKNSVYPEQVLVLWAAKRTGREVLWLGERSDGLLSDYQARDNISTAELALDNEGNFLALRVTTISAVGAYLAPKGQLSPTVNVQALCGVYRTPQISVSVTGVFTNTAPTEVYRGAGRPEAIHLLERLIDEAARATGIPRLDLRRRNLVRPEHLPYPTPLGLIYDSGDFPAMLDAALARADAANFETRRQIAKQQGKLRGLGLAHYCERIAGAWSEHAWLELDSTGRVTALLGTMSNGQGHETAYAQLLSEHLGLALDDIVIVQGDTDRIPSGHGTGGSASIPIAGAALVDGAADLIRKATPLAADALEAAEADITFTAGTFRIVGTDRGITLQALATRLENPLAGTGFWLPETPTFPNGCHIAEVEIDPETGETRLTAYTMLHDFGRVLNPNLLEGQLQGGVTQGIGQALHERVVHDPESGQLLTGSLMDYQLPRAADLPALQLITLPTAAPSHPLGIKGCGEAGAAGAPPAVMNAIMDALAPLGVAAIQMPATSERVWQAIQHAKAL